MYAIFKILEMSYGTQTAKKWVVVELQNEHVKAWTALISASKLKAKGQQIVSE